MNKLVFAISGASGAIYARLFMEALKNNKIDSNRVAVICSANAGAVWKHELGTPFDPAPFTQYDRNDFNAPFASGSADYNTMLVMPCSMGMIGRMAHGISDDLITRAADVMLKEKRKLILVPRETPFNLIHLRNLCTLSEAGAHIIPAMPSFYGKPETVEEVASTVCNRVLDHLGLSHQGFRWGNR